MLHPTAALLSPPHTAAAGTIAPGPRCPIRAGSGSCAPARSAAPGRAGTGTGRAASWGPPRGTGTALGSASPTAGPRLPQDTATAWQGGGRFVPPPRHRLCHPRTPRVCTAEELQKRARPLSKLVITHEKKRNPWPDLTEHRQKGAGTELRARDSPRWDPQPRGQAGIHGSHPAGGRASRVQLQTPRQGPGDDGFAKKTSSPVPRDELEPGRSAARLPPQWYEPHRPFRAQRGAGSLVLPAIGVFSIPLPSVRTVLVLGGQPAVREPPLDLGAHIILHRETRG